MRRIHGMSVVDFDLYVSSKYRSKCKDAKQRNLEFALTFAEFRSLYTRVRCEYTGINMCLPELVDGKQKSTNLTIERVDNRLGYVSGNCIAVCYAANNIKSVFENPSAPLTLDDAIKMFAKIGEMNNKINHKQRCKNIENNA